MTTASCSSPTQLTRLSNRLHPHEVLRRALEVSDRTGAPTTVLMIDMNGFKEVNCV